MKKTELLEFIINLQKQVTDLQTKLICLEIQLSNKQDKVVYIPSVWTEPVCPAGGHHEYPFPWHSTSPAPCKKCHTAPEIPSYTITCTTTDSRKFCSCGRINGKCGCR